MPPVDPLPVVRSRASRPVAPSSAALTLPLVIPAQSVKSDSDDASSQLIAFLFGHWRLLALGLFTGALLGSLFTNSQTPIYRATAVLEIQNQNDGLANLRDNAGADRPVLSEADLPTQIRLLQSASLLSRVVAHLAPEKVPAPRGLATFLPAPKTAPTPESRLEAAAQNLQVRDSRQTRIVDLAFESPDPQYAAAFLNQLASEYISQSIESRLEISKGTSEWLDRQMRELRTQLADSENRLQTYARSSGLIVTHEDRRPEEEKLRQLQENLSKAQENRAIRQARMETAVSAPLESLETPLGSALNDHQAKLAELRRQRADLATIYTPNFDGIKRLDAQIAALENARRNASASLLQGLKNDYEDAVRRERLLENSYQNQVGQVSHLSSVAIQYGILKREVDTNRQLYNILMQRAAESKIASALRASHARLVDSAKLPTRPVRPVRLMNIVWGASVGLLLALVLITARDRADRRIRLPRDLAFHLPVPHLGAIPRFRPLLLASDERLGAEAGLVRIANPADTLPQVALATWHHRTSAEAESYRAVLTSILFSQVSGRTPQVIVVTSAQPGDGKTTLVTNLAAALAQMKRTVLLVDAARERGLHQVFGLTDNYGLSDVLDLPEISRSVLAYVTHSTTLPGVSLVATGPRETSALELLYAMSPLLGELRSAYDILLIDAPSISELPDARVFGRMADGAILVVRAGETTLDTAAQAAARLQDDGTTVLGTVLNQSN